MKKRKSGLKEFESNAGEELEDKKRKTFKSSDSNVKELSKEDRCLDNLARLFQKTSQGCAAVTIIDQTIVIADNEIFSKQRNTEIYGTKIKLIRNIMQYFSDLANKSKFFQKSREDIFKEICIERLHGEDKGYIKLDDEILEQIAQNILNTYKAKGEDWRAAYAKKIQAYDPNQRPFVALSYELSCLVARDFLKIEKFIEDNLNKEENDLISAFKGKENTRIPTDQAGGIDIEDQGKVQYEEAAGYIILDIDASGVHAEAKIIEYLIFTGILRSLVEGEKIYIGISKLCCEGCNKFVNAINEVFGNKIEIIKTRGAHGLQPEWVQPIICQKDYIEERNEKEDEEGNKCILYLVIPEQINKLSELAPELRKESKDKHVYQTHYSSTSPGDSQSSHKEKEDLIKLSNLTNFEISQEFFKRFGVLLGNETRASVLEKIKNEITDNTEQMKKSIHSENSNIKALDSTWYDFLAIKEGLTNKKIEAKHILQSVVNSDELNERLDEIIEANSFYIIPLNVNALDGSFTATNHWVGLHIITNVGGKISSIKYINPIGQKIDEQLGIKIFHRTQVAVEDLTFGKGTQFAHEGKSGIELKGNINDCGPMLVQLLLELVNEGGIRTHSLGEIESAKFGQWCRENQKNNEVGNISENNNVNLEEEDNKKVSGEINCDSDE